MSAACNRLSAIVFAVLAAAPPGAATLAAQAAAAQDTTMPATGIDFAGVDQFWKIVDILTRGIEPSAAQWSALLMAPGYRLAQVNLGPVVQEDLEIAFKPSRRGEFDRLRKIDDDRGARLTHLALAAAQRPALVALRDSLARATPIADAIAMAARFLPPGATQSGAPPLVAFALFKDDGYSLPQGIVVDLMNAHGGTLIPILGHEFHHSYVNRLARTLPPEAANAADGALRDALYSLRNEGIADLIDKPYPFSYPNPAAAGYVARYNSEYARTPSVLAQLDSLLTSVADDSSEIAAAGAQASGLFWSNGHPNGSYIAREVLETFGVDSLLPGALDPAAFLRTFAAAERKHGRPVPFSAKAWQVIDRLDAKYWRR